MEGHYEKSTNVEKQSKNECYEGIGVRNYGTLSYSPRSFFPTSFDCSRILLVAKLQSSGDRISCGIPRIQISQRLLAPRVAEMLLLASGLLPLLSYTDLCY